MARTIKILLTLLISGACVYAFSAEKTDKAKKFKVVNKLLYMYKFYYLPIAGMEFYEGKENDEIVPLVMTDSASGPRVITPDELTAIDRMYDTVLLTDEPKTTDGKGGAKDEKPQWKSRSLLLSTPVSVNGTVRISDRIASHRISLSRGPLDGLSLDDRGQLNRLLQSRTPSVQADFKQLQFLKSFLSVADKTRFNFFIFSASWCPSCERYRVLFETYWKKFPQPGLVLHSVVIDDPKAEIFTSQVIKDLFPHPIKYSHNTVPRFLSLEMHGEQNVELKEEGEALQETYARFFKEHAGFLEGQSPLLFPKRGVAKE